MDTNPGVHGQHKLNLTGLGWEKKTQRGELGKWGTGLGRIGRGDKYDQITLYKILKDSYIILKKKDITVMRVKFKL